MKLLHQFMAIFVIFSPTSSHLHPLLVVDEDDNGKIRLERVKAVSCYSDPQLQLGENYSYV